MKIGDRIKFKKFDWVLVAKRHHVSGVVEYRYRVYRKYLKLGKKYFVPLTNTQCNYTIFPWRWNFLKRQVERNPEYHYNMSLWSNCPR